MNRKSPPKPAKEKSKDVGADMMFARVLVTPEMALDWLTGNTHNRPLHESRILQYLRVMERGAWGPNHQGIAFASDGQLLDGQHTLHAVYRYGKPVWLTVTRNVPKQALLVIDTQMTRSLSDSISLGGSSGMVNKDEVAVVRAAISLSPASASLSWELSRPEWCELVERHLEAAKFACQALPKSNYIRASVRAPILRAYYSVEHARLREFGAAVHEASSPDCHAIALLYRTLVNLGGGGGRSNEALRYGKTERTLMAFLQGERLEKIFVIAKECFPLCDELLKNNGNRARAKANAR